MSEMDTMIYWPYAKTPDEMLDEKDAEVAELKTERDALKKALYDLAMEPATYTRQRALELLGLDEYGNAKE